MCQRLGHRAAEVFTGSWQDIAMSMAEQPAFFNPVNMSHPKALLGNPKFSGKLAAPVNVGLLPASRYYQHPIRRRTTGFGSRRSASGSETTARREVGGRRGILISDG